MSDGPYREAADVKRRMEFELTFDEIAEALARYIMERESTYIADFFDGERDVEAIHWQRDLDGNIVSATLVAKAHEL